MPSWRPQEKGWVWASPGKAREVTSKQRRFPVPVDPGQSSCLSQPGWGPLQREGRRAWAGNIGTQQSAYKEANCSLAENAFS